MELITLSRVLYLVVMRRFMAILASKSSSSTAFGRLERGASSNPKSPGRNFWNFSGTFFLHFEIFFTVS